MIVYHVFGSDASHVSGTVHLTPSADRSDSVHSSAQSPVAKGKLEILDPGKNHYINNMI